MLPGFTTILAMQVLLTMTYTRMQIQDQLLLMLRRQTLPSFEKKKRKGNLVVDNIQPLVTIQLYFRKPFALSRTF